MAFVQIIEFVGEVFKAMADAVGTRQLAFFGCNYDAA
jgi:hypothetical protein